MKLKTLMCFAALILFAPAGAWCQECPDMDVDRTDSGPLSVQEPLAN
jgi:hypothetical protein